MQSTDVKKAAVVGTGLLVLGAFYFSPRGNNGETVTPENPANAEVGEILRPELQLDQVPEVDLESESIEKRTALTDHLIDKPSPDTPKAEPVLDPTVCAVQIKVTDGLGDPIAGAKIRFLRQHTGRPTYVRMNDTAKVEDWGANSDLYFGTTNENGTVELNFKRSLVDQMIEQIEGLHEGDLGSFAYSIACQGYHPFESEGDLLHLRVMNDPSAELIRREITLKAAEVYHFHGQIMARGENGITQPVPNATIIIGTEFSLGSFGGVTMGDTFYFEGLTNSDGIIMDPSLSKLGISGLLTEEAWALIIADGYPGSLHFVNATADDTVLYLPTESCNLELELVDEQGNPLPIADGTLAEIMTRFSHPKHRDIVVGRRGHVREIPVIKGKILVPTLPTQFNSVTKVKVPGYEEPFSVDIDVGDATPGETILYKLELEKEVEEEN